MGAMRKMAVYLGLVEDDALEYAEHETTTSTAARVTTTRARYSSVREVRPEPRADGRGAPHARSRPRATRVAVLGDGDGPRRDPMVHARRTELEPPRQRPLPDHHAAPAHLQRRTSHRRGVPRGHPGDHEPHRDGRHRRQAHRGLRRRARVRVPRHHRAGHQQGVPALARSTSTSPPRPVASPRTASSTRAERATRRSDDQDGSEGNGRRRERGGPDARRRPADLRARAARTHRVRLRVHAARDWRPPGVMLVVVEAHLHGRPIHRSGPARFIPSIGREFDFEPSSFLVLFILHHILSSVARMPESHRHRPGPEPRTEHPPDRGGSDGLDPRRRAQQAVLDCEAQGLRDGRGRLVPRPDRARARRARTRERRAEGSPRGSRAGRGRRASRPPPRPRRRPSRLRRPWPRARPRGGAVAMLAMAQKTADEHSRRPSGPRPTPSSPAPRPRSPSSSGPAPPSEPVSSAASRSSARSSASTAPACVSTTRRPSRSSTTGATTERRPPPLPLPRVPVRRTPRRPRSSHLRRRRLLRRPPRRSRSSPRRRRRLLRRHRPPEPRRPRPRRRSPHRSRPRPRPRRLLRLLPPSSSPFAVPNDEAPPGRPSAHGEPHGTTTATGPDHHGRAPSPWLGPRSCPARSNSFASGAVPGHPGRWTRTSDRCPCARSRPATVPRSRRSA